MAQARREDRGTRQRMDEMALKVQVYEEERRRLQGVEKAEKQVIEQLT